MYLGEYRINDYVLIAVQLHRFSSGAVYAPTGDVHYTIYENDTDNGPDGNPAASAHLAQRGSKTGFYTARVQLTAAAGYETGKDYLVLIEATVDGVAAAEVHTFRVIANPKVDLETIKTQAITCGAGVTIRADLGHAAAPGAENGAPTVAAGAAKLVQTVDLTAGQSIACSDKTGFSLSATGADLIVKSSTFIQAIVAAVNEFATYGLTALNTLLVTTGIKATSVPNVTLANGAHGGAATIITLQTPIESNVASETNHDFTALQKTSLNVPITDNHLDHLFTVAYDPASKPGNASGLLNILVENDAAVPRFTVNALEQAPSGSGSSPATIAAAVVDQALAGHTTAGTVGAAISALGGAGAIYWPITIKDDDSVVMADVDVWVTTDEAGANVVVSATTDAFGIVEFYLDAGTYYVFREKAGYNFNNPSTITVV